jgi:hypothetical protein
MKVHITGLTYEQWLICLIVSFTSLIWNAILKKVPDSIFPKLGDETEEEVRESMLDYSTLRGIASSNKNSN